MTQHNFFIPNSDEISPTDIHLGANLSTADPAGADLWDAGLKDASLIQTDLSGADLKDTDLPEDFDPDR